MEKVTGIGGIFVRSRAPEALALWYRDVLGVPLSPADKDDKPWVSQTGVTIFAPFSADTDYFPTRQQVMLNFRVADLAAMLQQVRHSGMHVFNEQEMDGVGRFAHVCDPDGNVIELWEPEPSPI
ncbi:MAG: VOC family protein [Pseudomonadota bacterium]